MTDTPLLAQVKTALTTGHPDRGHDLALSRDTRVLRDPAFLLVTFLYLRT